jgi:hypothetical protein
MDLLSFRQRLVAEMQAKYCHRNGSSTGGSGSSGSSSGSRNSNNSSNDSDFVLIGDGDDDGFLGYEFTGIDLSVTHLHSGIGGVVDDGGIFHQDPFQTPTTDANNKQITFHALCGNLTQSHRTVICTPQPDAFK